MGVQDIKHDPLAFLALLDDYLTTETARVRRNLTILSFSIIAVDLFDVPLDQLRLGTVPIMKGGEKLAAIVAGILLIYWGIVFALRYSANRTRYSEMRLLIESQAKRNRQRYEELQEKKKVEPGGVHGGPGEMQALKVFLRLYDEQYNRTAFGRQLQAIYRLLEWLPAAVLAIWAGVLCVSLITCA